MLESFGFYDDYKPTLRILQEGLGNGVLRHSYFFADFCGTLHENELGEGTKQYLIELCMYL